MTIQLLYDGLVLCHVWRPAVSTCHNPPQSDFLKPKTQDILIHHPHLSNCNACEKEPTSFPYSCLDVHFFPLTLFWPSPFPFSLPVCCRSFWNHTLFDLLSLILFFFSPKRLCRLSKTWLYCCWKFHVLWWTIFTAVRLLDHCLDFCWHRQIRGWVWMSFIKFWFQDISLPGSMEWQFSLFLYSFTASLVREQIETKIEEEVKGRITWSLSFCQSVLPDSCRVM